MTVFAGIMGSYHFDPWISGSQRSHILACLAFKSHSFFFLVEIILMCQELKLCGKNLWTSDTQRTLQLLL